MLQTYVCPECESPVAFSVQLCGNCGTILSWSTRQSYYYLPGPQQKRKKTWLFTLIGLVVISILIGVSTTYGIIAFDSSLHKPVYSAAAISQPAAQYKPPSLSVPTLLSPGLFADPGQIIDTITPLFQWDTVAGADYYSLAISEFPYGPNDMVYTPTHLAGTSLMVPANVLEYGQKYQWTIEAHSNNSPSSTSVAMYFQTPQFTPSSTSLFTPSLVYPANPPPSQVTIPASPPSSVPLWSPPTVPGGWGAPT